jgi:hypothetical protein
MTCNSGFVSRFLTEGRNIYSSAAWLSVRKKSAQAQSRYSESRPITYNVHTGLWV